MSKEIEIPFNYLGESVLKGKDGKPMADGEGKPYPPVYTFDGEFKINRVEFGIGEEITLGNLSRLVHWNPAKRGTFCGAG